MSTSTVVWRIDQPRKYPFRERNVVYLVLLSYSLWARLIAKQYLALIIKPTTKEN